MQPLSENNKLLFNEQVKDHIDKLNGLMTLASGMAIEAGSIRKACLATKLLEGSTSMLGIEPWSGTLTMFRELLDKSSRSNRCWDEQLSQIVSEVLETEEQVIMEIMGRLRSASLLPSMASPSWIILCTPSLVYTPPITCLVVLLNPAKNRLTSTFSLANSVG